MTSEMHSGKIEVIESMGVSIRPPLSPENPHILDVDVQGEPVSILGIHSDGRFSLIENELLERAKGEMITAIPRWNSFPDGVRHSLSVLNQVGFRLKADKIQEEGQDVYWIKTDGFGPHDSEIGGENVLILFFNKEGDPLRWEVPTNG